MPEPVTMGGAGDPWAEGADAAEETVTFTLDGRQVTAPKGEMLIAAAERAGTFIPRFCYHPRMESVGVCRMCLVEVSGPRGATLQPSCFIEVSDGAEVVTDSPKVKKAQDGVLEFLLVNHPLDCPVCDKGGECPLQDQTLAYGPGETRFVEEKRHFEKPIAISELVLLDRERCIQCSRCTRFAAEVAGEALIDFAGRGELVEVSTFPDRPFDSYFSGNTVQICPVGALTAKPYRFTARPWDLDQVESTCTTCALGCRVVVQSSANRVTRLLGIDSEPVNHGWLCDKGRFAYEATEADERITQPLVRKDGALVPVSWHEALDAAAEGLAALRPAGATAPRTGGAVGVIGGARLTNEGAYAWTRLAKGVLGTDSVDAQLGDGLPAEVVLGLPRATVDDVARADTVLLLTGDVREELPVLFLRLRAAVLGGTTSVVELSPQATSVTPFAAVSLRVGPGDAPAALERLVGRAGDSGDTGETGDTGAAVDADAWVEARRLLGARKVAVVVGRPSLAEDARLVASAACALAHALPGARFLPALRRGNVHGALDMGMAPGLLPGRTSLEDGRAWFAEAWGAVPERRGRDTLAMLASAAGEGTEDGAERVRALLVVGADPLADVPDRRLARAAFDAAELVVVVAGSRTATTERADVVLPAAEAHERPGTTTNVEGRVSRLGQKVVPPGQAWPDWMIAVELAAHLGADLGLDSLSAVWDEVERLAPAYAGLTRAVLDAPGSADGVVVPLSSAPVSVGARPRPLLDPIAFPGVESVERQGAPPRAGRAEVSGPAVLAPARTVSPGKRSDAPPPPVLGAPVAPEPPHVAPTDSYSHRLVATRRLFDRGAAVVASPALAALVEPAPVRVHPHDLDDLGLASGDRARLRTARGSVEVEVRGDPALPRKVVATEVNVPLSGDAEAAVADLVDLGAPVTEVRLETT